MQWQWESISEKFRQWYRAFTGLNVSNISTGLCALGVTPHELSLAIRRHPDSMTLDFLISFPLSSPEDFGEVLSEAVSDYKLYGMSVHWILYADQYYLYLMDNLPVEAQEFQSAIRWKLMDVLPFSVEDAVIDSFQIPAQKTHDLHSMMMVSAARASFLKNGVEVIMQAGLNPTQIGIQTLSLRNIAALFEKDERSTALVYMTSDQCEVLVTRLGLLYLHRNFGLGLQHFGLTEKREITDRSALDSLSLELQRSLDYYQSQWRHALPSKILLATTGVHAVSEVIATYLTESLAIFIQPLSLQNVVTMDPACEQQFEGRLLPVMGGIVHRSFSENAAGN